ncbi:MAG: preprotein translocase subunit SecA [Firmicutes bacterium HGW-Firmicutes-13]|nr:MAG: preprotein translocase subunit SecA [Firmicutes bacterium HGW-Firmicutes-13]
MLKFINRLFGNMNDREVKKLNKIVEKVNSLENEISSLTDSRLRGETEEFKDRLKGGSTLEDLLPEAFAVVREAAKRTLGMRPFDVQVLGGVVLHQGRIAEMKTGEGKTLVATLPAYLNALTGKGVHIVTVNDYLAKRDSEWMGRIYKFLGLQVGLIVHGLNSAKRKEAYGADITYGTNNEFGFDYLRDNMIIYKDQLVQRELSYAIVDEVDSILIDEARTPLIISGQAQQSTNMYQKFAQFVPGLKLEDDYTVDEKAHTVLLTEKGVAKSENFLGVENLYDDINMELSHYLNQALKAQFLMRRDRDYVLKDGEVIIVDEFTGRLMYGRRYSNGLHQAIEAKEKVKVAKESQTLATITFQNYFRMFDKLAGMTGTAATEEEEFRKIYGLDVVVIPTNEPMIREDLPDVVYKTEKAKFRAIVEEIESRHNTDQPCLVGTISIEKSEILSDMLGKKGIAHQVLNAKYHEKEAHIVSQAGRRKMVTIATNMAGRGTDIMLGGNPSFLAEGEFEKKYGCSIQELEEGNTEMEPSDREKLRKEFQELLRMYRNISEKEKEIIVGLGGLHIIGTERHESRRIDNQLRGRTGRQGDPGSTQFFISLEDDLMRLFGSDNIMGVMEKLGLEEDQPIDHPMISRAIESAQKKVEARNFDIRRHVLEYDDVMNQQRELIYSQRHKILQGENLKDSVLEMVEKIIDDCLDLYANEKVHFEEWDLKGLLDYAKNVLSPNPGTFKEDDLEELDRDELKDLLIKENLQAYEKREEELGSEIMRDLERLVLLRTVDSKWMQHIDAMDNLKQGIGLRAYGQRNPLIEYKFEGYEMFQNMIRSIQEDVVKLLFRVQIVSKKLEPRAAAHTPEALSAGKSEQKKAPVKKGKKIGRNDPCPCGSGKKYKRCCGR